MQPNNLYNVCKFILNYLKWCCIVLFWLGVAGVSLSMFEEYKLHRFIDKENERIKNDGKMDTNRQYGHQSTGR